MSSTPLPDNNMQRAQREAVERARAQLSQTDVAGISRRTGIVPNPAGEFEVSLLGRKLHFILQDLSVRAVDTAPVSAVEELLVLRYLSAEREVRVTGELITFRDLPGGRFYLQPILNRTTQMLLGRLGNDMAALKNALTRFPSRLLELGDLSAAVSAIGRLEITLVYRLGDEEFPPTLDLLFDRAMSSVYMTDEIAALSHLFCRGVMRGASGCM